jgi:RNA polymerase sigma-70 factor (ECF subfamily)
MRAAQMEEGELVTRTLEGDLSAFETLVQIHQGVVYRVAARVVGREEAHDVAQDAFLRAFHRLGQFRRDAPFRAWLLQIAHRAALDHLARRRRLPVPDDEAALEAPDAAAGPRTPAEELEAAERRERLEMKLALLPPVHREVLVLRDLEGLSYDEVATATESPLGSVKGRLHRARAELIALLRANAYDWELPQ